MKTAISKAVLFVDLLKDYKMATTLAVKKKL